MNTENRNNVRLKMIVGKILDASKYGGMVGMVWMVGMIGMLGWAGRNRTYNIEYRMYDIYIYIYIYKLKLLCDLFFKNCFPLENS